MEDSYTENPNITSPSHNGSLQSTQKTAACFSHSSYQSTYFDAMQWRQVLPAVCKALHVAITT